MVDDKNTQITPEPISSEPSAPSEPTEQAPISPTESTPVEAPPVSVEAPKNSEEAVPVKDDIPANEPLNPVPEPEISTDSNNPNITVEKHGNDITITEVMNPTAQMAGNEPIAERRKENLKLANQTRQDKKRKKIGEILDLFAKQTNLTNDEVEKLLHVSDATST